MKYPIILCALTLHACGSLPKNQAEKEDWQQLFNGKDLSGWNIKIRGHALNDNYASTFQVQNGSLVVSYEKFDEPYGHIFYDQPFSYYRLQTEYRFVDEQAKEGPGWALRNNGLMLHSQSA